jgi:hypothetical protein
MPAEGLPPVGESREVRTEFQVNSLPAILPAHCGNMLKVVNKQEFIPQLTHEEFYALPFYEQMKAVKDGRF